MRKLILSISILFFLGLFAQAQEISITDYVKYERNARLTYADGYKLAENDKSTLLVWFKFTPEQVIPLYQSIKDPVINVFLDHLDNFPTNEPTLLVGQWKNGQLIQVKTIKSDFLTEIDSILHPKPIKIEQNSKIVQDLTHKTSPGPNDHAHRCSYCGTTWYHDDSSFNNEAAHRCPNCNKGPFYNRIIPQTVIQPEIIQRFNYCPPGRT